MEFLKDILGEGYADFESKINAYNQNPENQNKQIKLANLSTGEFVSRNKYAALETEMKGYKTQLTEANNQISAIKDMDIEGIKQSAAEWESKYKKDTEALQGELVQQQREFAAEKFLGGYKFSSELARKAAVSDFKAQNLDFKDGKFIGAEEYMKQLQESDPASFILEDDSQSNSKSGSRWTRGTQNSYKPQSKQNDDAYLETKYKDNPYFEG